VDFIEKAAFRGAFWQRLFQDAFLAGAFNKISDFKIVFKFKVLFGHISTLYERKDRTSITRFSISQV